MKQPKCPRCGGKTKQLPISKEAKKGGFKGRRYCGACGWLAGHDKQVFSSLIGK